MDYPMLIAQQMLRYITSDRNTLYVFCPFSMGDFLVIGGLCHALLKKKRKNSCVMILSDRFENSGTINFVGVKEIRYMPQLLMNFIRQYIYATRDYETDNFIYGHFQMKQNFEDWNAGIIANSNLIAIDCWKENFGLPLDTEFLPPIIASPTDYQKQRLHETYVLDKERTIILAPYANSIANLEESFWAQLVAGLKQKNKDYVFYTNVAAPHEKVIPSTSPIKTTFQELKYLAENVNCFIGLRSGFFDLLAFTNSRFIYINKSISWLGNFDVNFNHTNNKAFYLASAPEQAQLQALMQYNNLSSIDNITFLGRILGKDIALNADSLLERIINEVD